MAKIDGVQEVAIAKLKPYERNARIHSDEQIEMICKSIQEFGFISPCLITKDNEVIAGHGRLEAAKQLGLKKVPCVYVEGLTEEQYKAYVLVDNKLTELGGWDLETLEIEMNDINLDMTEFGFYVKNADWFSDREYEGAARQEGNDEYNDFLEKFEDKKTTDDCYTPQNVYDAIADWVAKEYGLKKSKFVRPFFPGGDYQAENYKGKVVVDNPPFSILSEIEEFYNEHNVKFFLFAPSVACFAPKRRACAVCTGGTITYENGAKVPTSFVTNLENYVARTAPDLYKAIEKIDKENTQGNSVPLYKYPNNVITAAMMSKLSKYGQDFKIKDEDASDKIGALDSQKDSKNGIFGGGYLLSEKAAAEKAAAIEWELSDREMQIIKELGGNG